MIDAPPTRTGCRIGHVRLKPHAVASLNAFMDQCGLDDADDVIGDAGAIGFPEGLLPLPMAQLLPYAALVAYEERLLAHLNEIHAHRVWREQE